MSIINLKNTNKKTELLQKKSINWIPEKFVPGLFSLIVPTFNRAHTIIETLDSVWNQTHRPIEIIICDDGSTDNTCEVVGSWKQEHQDNSEFTCTYEYKKNAGVCAARNQALKKSTGQYIQFIDSDDTIYPERLEKLVSLFRDSRCDYIETGFEGFLSENREVVEVHRGHTSQDQLELLLKGRLWPNTLRPAYTRELIIRTGPWNENMITFQDYEYVIRALTLQPLPICRAISEVLASARRDGGERMSDIFKTREGRILRIHCEKILCDAVRGRKDIHRDWQSQLASRLYALGFRSNACGWTDLGRKCGVLAESMGVELDALGRRRRLVWRLGRMGGLVYECLHRFKAR